MPINVAIDGHSASGKSTIAIQLAQKTGLVYLDTGLMYRALAYEIVQLAGPIYAKGTQVSPEDEAQFHSTVKDFVKGWTLDVKLPAKAGADCIMISQGVDISAFLHRPEVARMVSKVAAISEVRSLMVRRQQELAQTGGMILVGRDIASVVLPNAELKVFVTADLAVRAQRRHLEFVQKGSSIPLERVHEDLENRDLQDTTRADSPLICVPGAKVLDTTHLTPDQVLETLVGWVEDAQRTAA
jgi:CMP/dCMP kinase